MRSLFSWPLALLFCGWLTYDRLREPMPKSTPVATANVDMPPTIAGPQSEIDAKLDKNVSWEFHDAALSDVVQYIAEDLKLPIYLHETSLSNGGIPTDLQIRFHLDNVRARTALKLLLEEHRLMAVRMDNCLVVKCEGDELEREMRVYAVSDLVKFEDERGTFTEIHPLVDAIILTIEPDKWSQGENWVKEVSAADTLTIHATDDVHEKIGQFLTALRAAREVQGLRGPTKVRRAGMGIGGGISGGGLGGGGCF